MPQMPANYVAVASTDIDDVEVNKYSVELPTFKEDDDIPLQTVEIDSKDSTAALGDEICEDSTTFQKLFLLIRKALPVVLTFFLNIGGTFISLYFAGRISTREDDTAIFAGISLANMFANVSWISLLVGMTTAVETLCSQHNGAERYREAGLVLHRSFIILGVLIIPIALTWYVSESIFHALGVETDVCAVINLYLRVRMITMPIDVINESYKKFLMSIGVMEPSLYVNVLFNVSLLVLNYLFIEVWQYGYEFVGIAFVISVYIATISLILISYGNPAVQRVLQPFDREAFDDIWEYVKLGVPGCAMICSEWWAFEILAMFASIIGTEAVSAQTIVLQISSLAFMVPLGIGISASSIVGNTIGAGNAGLATQFGRLAIALIIAVEGLLMCPLLYFLGTPFVLLFTQDSEVIRLSIATVPYMAAFAFLDGVQGVASGILRGTGKQHIGAVANVVAYYVFGLPLSWVLCFNANLGVIGLMGGVAIGTSIQALAMLYFLFCKESYVYSSPSASISAMGSIEMSCV